MANETVVPGYEGIAYDNRLIPVKQIQLPEYALREAQVESPEFLRLKDSIAKHGYFANILVRELPGHTEESPSYGVIDGTQRFTIAQQLGLSEIPCRVISADEADVAQMQIIANAVHVTTTPAQYSLQLRMILNSNPTMTRAELADRLQMSEKWLNDRLSLNNLCEKAKTLVDDGLIKLSSAFALAKLQPPDQQEAFLHEAATDTFPEFSGKIEARIKEIRKANQTGKKVGEREFVAVPHFRKLSEVTAIINEGNTLPIKEAFAREEPKSFEDAFLLGLKYSVQLDPKSIEEKKAKDAAVKLEREIAAAKRAEEAAELKKKTALAAIEKLNAAAAD